MKKPGLVGLDRGGYGSPTRQRHPVRRTSRRGPYGTDRTSVRYDLERSPHVHGGPKVIQAAQFRVLGELNPRLEHRHGTRWARMDRTIPMLSDRQPKAYRSTWICQECGECVLHEWRAS
jgi:hypothetical protein